MATSNEMLEMLNGLGRGGYKLYPPLRESRAMWRRAAEHGSAAYAAEALALAEKIVIGQVVDARGHTLRRVDPIVDDFLNVMFHSACNYLEEEAGFTLRGTEKSLAGGQRSTFAFGRVEEVRTYVSQSGALAVEVWVTRQATLQDNRVGALEDWATSSSSSRMVSMGTLTYRPPPPPAPSAPNQ